MLFANYENRKAKYQHEHLHSWICTIVDFLHFLSTSKLVFVAVDAGLSLTRLKTSFLITRFFYLQVVKGNNGTGTLTTRGRATLGSRNCSRHSVRKQHKPEKHVKLSPLPALPLISRQSRRHRQDHLLNLHHLLLRDKVTAPLTKVKDKVQPSKVKVKVTALLVVQCILKVKVRLPERQNCWKVVWY